MRASITKSDLQDSPSTNQTRQEKLDRILKRKTQTKTFKEDESPGSSPARASSMTEKSPKKAPSSDPIDFTKSLLSNVYRKSLKTYDTMADKLEKKGKVDHLKANINFRLSLKDDKKDQYVKRVT